MASGGYEWLTMEQAAARFGYGQVESLRRRLRRLRETGQVLDQGSPPPGYAGRMVESKSKDRIILYWPNSQLALMRSDSPADLLVPKRGKRASHPADSRA